MDALEFFEERKRMCDSSYDKELGCDFCDANSEAGLCMVTQTIFSSFDNFKKAIEIVENWSKSRPRKTRLQDFKEKYPSAPFNDSGYPRNCCKLLGYCEDCPKNKSCGLCWKEFVD